MGIAIGAADTEELARAEDDVAGALSAAEAQGTTAKRAIRMRTVIEVFMLSSVGRSAALPTLHKKVRETRFGAPGAALGCSRCSGPSPGKGRWGAGGYNGVPRHPVAGAFVVGAPG